MNDVLEFDDFVNQWQKQERDRHRQILAQLKRELAQVRRGSDLLFRPCYVLSG